MSMLRDGRWLVLVGGLGLTGPVLAECKLIQSSEYAMLPPYCYAKCELPDGHPDVRRWAQWVGGKNWNHLHHFCFALKFENQVIRTRDAREVKFINQRIEAGYNYVLQRWSSDCPLLPEAHVGMGRVLEAQARAPEARAHFDAALKLNPKYERAYGELSDWYKKAGDASQAKAVLEAGLKVSPDSKSLNRKLERLEKAEPAASVPAGEPAPGSTGPVPEDPAGQAGAQPPP